MASLSLATFGLITTAAFLSLFRLPGFFSNRANRQEQKSSILFLGSTRKPFSIFHKHSMIVENGNHQTQLPNDHIIMTPVHTTQLNSPNLKFNTNLVNFLSDVKPPSPPIVDRSQFWYKFYGDHNNNKHYEHYERDKQDDDNENDQTDQSDPHLQLYEQQNSKLHEDECQTKINYHYHMYLVKGIEAYNLSSKIMPSKNYSEDSVMIVTGSNPKLMYPMFNRTTLRSLDSMGKKKSIFDDEHYRNHQLLRHDKELFSKLIDRRTVKTLQKPLELFNNFNNRDNNNSIITTSKTLKDLLHPLKKSID